VEKSLFLVERRKKLWIAVDLEPGNWRIGRAPGGSQLENEVEMTGDPAIQAQRIAVRCIECDVVATGSADGWKVYIGEGGDGEPAEVVIYCPECAAREFADDE
jgi:hypothetical protein